MSNYCAILVKCAKVRILRAVHTRAELDLDTIFHNWLDLDKPRPHMLTECSSAVICIVLYDTHLGVSLDIFGHVIKATPI